AMIVIAATPAKPTAPERITVQEVIAKHLDSIGTAQARAAVKNQIILGTASANFRNGGGQLQGKAVLASEGKKSLINMVFGVTNYPYEAIGYDGANLTIGRVGNGGTALGTFLYSYDVIIKEGLFGGTLSTAWPLLDMSSRNAKIEYAGTKTIDGRQLHKLTYMPKKGADIEITLYFDAQTFQHVRTEYYRTIASQQGNTVDTSARQRELHYKLTEEFADFKPESGGLTLPHTYKLHLSVEGNQRTFFYDWEIKLQEFHFNHPIDEQAFRLVQTNS
ncbi:MAG TPA: hypothetical protein VK619_00405, partial [Pyrinomonadaceae bacterium]|nr:hypothetical protein [Pyrinomonadaceae bacterium]